MGCVTVVTSPSAETRFSVMLPSLTHQPGRETRSYTRCALAPMSMDFSMVSGVMFGVKFGVMFRVLSIRSPFGPMAVPPSADLQPKCCTYGAEVQPLRCTNC